MLAGIYVLLALVLAAASQPARSQKSAPPPPGQATAAATPAKSADAADRLVVPEGTAIPLELRNNLSSRTAYAGQAIYCDTIFPITVNNRIVIPVGSYVRGKVTQVVRPGRVKGKAQLGLRFDSIVLPNGTTRVLNATLSSFAGSGNEGFKPAEGKVTGESTKGKDAETIGITAAEGAGIGSIAGISSGHSGTGAAAGGAAGALGGLIYVLVSRGKDIQLAPGTSLELTLSTPLNFERDELDFPPAQPADPALPHRDPGPGF